MTKIIEKAKHYLKLKHAQDKISTEIKPLNDSLKDELSIGDIVKIPRKIGTYKGVYIQENQKVKIDLTSVDLHLTSKEKSEFFVEDLKLSDRGKTALKKKHKKLLKCIKSTSIKKLMPLKDKK